MKKSIILTMVMGLLLSVNATAQKKYEDIYMGMSNMTLIQQYSELMEFQRQSPQFANTYIQLGIISKNLMILTDPLRDIETAQFWADNAVLFFGNFKAYYEAGDVRSNSDYYANLRIPQAGKRLAEAEVFDFVEKNLRLCQSFKDSTLLAYRAIEKSKMYYNRCITTFRDICLKYPNQNEALLQHDEQLQSMFSRLGSDIDSCVEAFKAYKTVLKAYPIMNYRQLYDLENIETFRLDGITNSNFYDNRFTMWDYRKWMADFEKVMKEEILPLRKTIEDIDDVFAKAKRQFETTGIVADCSESPYDNNFVYRLGRYDNNSLVRELFSYFDACQSLMQMASDSLIVLPDTAEMLQNRKIRHLYRMSQTYSNVCRRLEIAKEAVSSERIARFKQFFEKKYNGENGVKAMLASEDAFLNGVMVKALGHFKAYRDAVLSSRDTLIVMKNNYEPTHYLRNAEGAVEYVAGKKKGVSDVCYIAKLNTEGKPLWTTDIRKTQEITALSVVSEGVAVMVRQNEMPNAIVYGSDGKQKLLFSISEGRPTCMTNNAITKIYHVCHDINNEQSSIAKLDSLGGKIWDKTLEQIHDVKNILEVDGGDLLLVGSKNGVGNVLTITADGELGGANDYFEKEQLSIDVVYRASAQEICLICRSEDGSMHLVIIDNKAKVTYTTKR